nr:hypothetical protein [Gemmatimonadaceae bacterium]
MRPSVALRLTEPSGLTPLDAQLGGLVGQRPYLVSGNPGAGKSVACLEFLGAALERGERAAFLTHDDPRDVLDTADFLGFDLARALRDERVMLLRFQLDFARRMARAPELDRVLDELRDFVAPFGARRLAIDSVQPFLEGGGNTSAGTEALVAMLDALGVTALLTYPGDLTASYDRRLEPLMQRAAGLFNLVSRVDGRRGGLLEIRKLRWGAQDIAPIPFRIEPGLGYVPAGIERRDDGQRIPPELRRALLALHFGEPFRAELLDTLGAAFQVTPRGDPGALRPEELERTAGVLVLHVRRDVMLDALGFVRTLRRARCRIPIACLTPYQLRSADRTRALRAGADDFLSTQLPPGELLARLESLVQRGWSDAQPTTDHDGPLVVQARDDAGAWRPLVRREFVGALETQLARVRSPFFSVLVASTAGRDEAALLGAQALRLVRLDSGDLVAVD